MKGVKDNVQCDPTKISELPVIIEFGLPQRLKGIKNYINHMPITRENFSEFFSKLESMWDFLDYDLLGCIIFAYENDELIEKLEEYELEVEKFITETTIYELLICWKPRYAHGDIPNELISCVTELSWDPKINKVKELKVIQHKLRNSLPQELAKTAFYIGTLKPGSVTVLWLVWMDYLPQVMTSLRNLLLTQPEFITDNQISYLSLDNVILYSSYNNKVCI